MIRNFVSSKNWLAGLSLCVLALCLALCCSGCSGVSQQDSADVVDPIMNISDTSAGVAATVNGVDIGEAAITAYIENYRKANNLTTDDAWGEWLVESGYGIESVRRDTIDYYVSREVLKQVASEFGFSADSSEIDEQYETAKSQYSDDAHWEATLLLAGMTEEMYRENIEINILQNMILDEVSKDIEVSDDEVLSYLNSYYQDYADVENLEDVDEESLENAREGALAEKKQTALTDYIAEFKNNSDIQYNDMPEGLSYDIDLTPYESAYYSDFSYASAEDESDPDLEGALDSSSASEDAADSAE